MKIRAFTQADHAKEVRLFKRLDREIDTHIDNIANESLILAEKLYRVSGGLYKHGGFRNMSEYAKSKAIDVTHQRLSQLSRCGAVIKRLRENATDCCMMPENEAQARPLTKLTGNQIVPAWREVCEEVKGNGKHLSQPLVKRVAKRLYPKRFQKQPESRKASYNYRKAAAAVRKLEHEDLMKLLTMIQKEISK